MCRSAESTLISGFSRVDTRNAFVVERLESDNKRLWEIISKVVQLETDNKRLWEIVHKLEENAGRSRQSVPSLTNLQHEAATPPQRSIRHEMDICKLLLLNVNIVCFCTV